MTQPEFDEQQFIAKAFSDKTVKAAIEKTNWFTIKKIRRIVEKTKVPTRIGLFGPYKNPELAACLEAAEPPLSKEHAVFLQLYLFLKENMISPQGHAFASTFIPFLSEAQVSELLSELGLPPKFDIDRGVTDLIPTVLLCLVAPKRLRNQLVKIIFSSSDEQILNSLFVWAMVVRAGTQEFSERSE